LTSHLDTNYHPERWDKARSVPRMLIKQTRQETNVLFFGMKRVAQSARYLWVIIILAMVSFPRDLPAKIVRPDRQVSDYRQFLAIYAVPPSNSPSLILRAFKLDGRSFYLVVNPERLETSIQPAAAFRVAETSWQSIRERLKDSPYMKAIEDVESAALPLQDAGITHFSPNQSGVDLTVDLCPSSHPLDRQLFSAVFDAFGKEERPVPLAIAITGVWMEQHEEDVRWLSDLEQKNLISITWVNHSFHHRLSRNLPLRENFLLEKGTDTQAEVLDTEAMMIALGLLPSVFFRFPGLVSDKKVFRQITSFGLIPVGSDAWLAKKQWPHPGSIILVHATGNEPIGIQRFLQLIKAERENILNKHWLLFDLRESTVTMEKKRSG
jgi:hypothetical protein